MSILVESFSGWLGSVGGWALEESDVFNMFRIRFCSCVAWGFWIVIAAGRIGRSVATKINYCINIKK